jgi:hypothetical protein
MVLHKSNTLAPILNDINPVHILISYFLWFILILSSHLYLSLRNWTILSTFQNVRIHVSACILLSLWDEIYFELVVELTGLRSTTWRSVAAEKHDTKKHQAAIPRVGLEPGILVCTTCTTLASESASIIFINASNGILTRVPVTHDMNSAVTEEETIIPVNFYSSLYRNLLVPQETFWTPSCYNCSDYTTCCKTGLHVSVLIFVSPKMRWV